jgi:carboxymethylenebutenolidase
MAVVRTSKVDLKINGEGAYAFVAQPDDTDKHPGLVLIQEWWGIESHVIDLATKLAAEGFVVAVPDLYHGMVVTEPNEAQKEMMVVVSNMERAISEITGALDTVRAMPEVEPKKLGLIGFCMGGLLTYKVAARYAGLGAIVPFYGVMYDPTPEDAAKVTAPVLAIYGKNDHNIPETQIEKIEQTYKAAGKDITVKVYDAGHAFLNPLHGAFNEAAASQAWPLAVSFLKDKLK